nr:hypothetical protein [Tanacetum cinerariifolium]
MDTLVDFSPFLMNRLKVDTLTPELLAGPTYELMKGSCKSLVELEFFLEEVYKETTNQLDWNNPEGQQYPRNLLKPLPLIPNSRGRHVITFNHFINNDLEYLRGGASNRKYITSVTKTKAADYGHIKWIEDLVPRTMWSQEPLSSDKHALWGISHWGRKRQQFYRFAVNRESARDVNSKCRIIAVTELQIVEWHNYKHLDWIMTNLMIEERFTFNVSLKMFTRSIVIQRHMEDLQLGVKSYQNKLNLTKPDTYHSDLKRKEAYTAYSNPRGFIYQNIDKQNRLMRIDELYKFSDGMLNDVRTALDDRLKAKDEKDHAKSGEVCWCEIVRGRLQDATTDHMIYHMMSLSYKVSVEVLRYDKRSKSETIRIVPTEMELILEHTQQGISHEVSVTLTKPKRMIKLYSSHRFIANCFNAGHLKMDVKNSVKRQKTSEYEAYVSGESSSGQDNEKDQDDDEIPTKQVSQDIMEEETLVSPHPQKTTLLVLSCQRDPEALALSLINQDLLYLKKGSSGPEKIVLSLHKFPAVIFNDDDIKERTSRWVNKCVKKFNPYARYGVEHWKNPHAKIFYIRKQKKPEKPKENLNKNDIEDMYLLIMNGKVPDYAEIRLLWSLSVFIRSLVIWERVHDFQLEIESYQQKVNLTAPTISFPRIKKHEKFSIIYEPVHGIIYKNSKKEKRVMRYS